MKKLIIFILLTSTLFSCDMLFKKRKKIENQFAGYDSQNQLRPKINKADFYRMTGFDLGWLLLEPLNISKSKEEEPELVKRFSEGQKALYFWWYLDGQVTNGGFVQFYYNGYDIYIPAIIKGLEYIGDKEMVELIHKANKIYLENKKIIDKAKESDLFESDLYKQLEKLEEFDNKYYEINSKTMSLIEKYAKENSTDFCIDENGLELSKNYSGKCNVTFDNGEIKEEFDLLNGKIEGEFTTYFENGNTKSIQNYSFGKRIGKQKDFYENKELKLVITIDSISKEQKKEFYYNNGKLSKLEHLDINNKRKGEYKEWYSNGQLKEMSTFTSNTDRVGDWLKFWEDGSKKLEAEFKDGKVYFHNYWDNKGNKSLINGTGLYVNEYSIGKRKTRREEHYVNYERNGLSTTFKNGKLRSQSEFINGLENGLVKKYNDNEVLIEVNKYKDGRFVSKEKID